jgi:hypothetical protein
MQTTCTSSHVQQSTLTVRVHHQHHSLLSRLSLSSTAMPRSSPIENRTVLFVLVIAIIQHQNLLSQSEVVVILLRLLIILVNALLLLDRLLLVALTRSQESGFLALHVSPLLAQSLDVVVQLVDAVADHQGLLVQVLQLADVQVALFAEPGEAGLDFIAALVLLDLRFGLAAEVGGDVARWRWSGHAGVVTCRRIY